ncbi:MAG TPA: carboxypeptidase regulatory-like domain-containing protein [Chitinophagaceae bacterium]|nr:carboxypeptidase regulatory-like domain-containing protein [Chitinophagaceae bacterium]
MKKTGLTLCATILAVVALHSFGYNKAGSISGSVIPADGAVSVWAIQSPDTIKAMPANGIFSLTARAGNWKVIIDAKEPYQDVMMENVQVNDGKETSLGEIRLQK